MGVAFLWLAAGADGGFMFGRARVGTEHVYGNGKNFTEIFCSVNYKSTDQID
jgi:hypothetical protein